VEYFKRWKMTQHGRPEAEANTAHLKKWIENVRMVSFVFAIFVDCFPAYLSNLL